MSTDKLAIGNKNLFLPSPVTLVGTMINNKPNYLAVAWCSIVNNMPPMVSISLYHLRFTRAGITENGTFSINVPSARQVKETDYCGIFSGRHKDKSQVFESFFGRLKTAPMIRSCPINIECKLHSTFNVGTHDLYVGEIVEIYVDEAYMIDGVPDMKSIDPMVCTWKGNYWHVGDLIARTFNAGKDYK